MKTSAKHFGLKVWP